MSDTLPAVLLSSLLFLSFTSGCHHLPAAQIIGARPYMLQMRMECKGGKVYDIDNVQDIEQCKEACRQFDTQCLAVNLFQLGEFQFKCEILNSIYTMVPATGAACYYASDAYPGGAMGAWGRRK